MAPDRKDVLKGIEHSRRRFLRTVIAGAAFAPPVLMSFSMDGLSVDPVEAQSTPTPSPSASPVRCSNMTIEPPIVFYLDRGAGGNLLLTETAPTSTTAKFTDSPALSRSNGNPWKPIGAWDAIIPPRSCPVEEVSDLHVWVGLRNSDDQGTQFDLRADFMEGNALIATGEINCISGLVRNPARAQEVVVSFGPADMTFLSGAVTLVLKARIGTGCPGHASASGLRVYYGSAAQDSSFDVHFS
jgi:hypothetical protein